MGGWRNRLRRSEGDTGKVEQIRRAGVPIVMGGAGLGGRAHAANEYYVIEGAGKIYGMAGAEKGVALTMYGYAGKIPPAPARSTTN